MHRSIVKRIAKKAKISWHPSTKKLHESYVKSFDDDYLMRVIKMLENNQTLNHQTVYVTSNKKVKKKGKKNNIDYKIIAGVFNPWFNENILKESKNITVIELEANETQTKKSFEEELNQFIMLDYLKSIAQGNIAYIGNVFFNLKEIITQNELRKTYTQLTGRKISADQFAEHLGLKRDSIYRHKRSSLK